jgi:hypothetical protein
MRLPDDSTRVLRTNPFTSELPEDIPLTMRRILRVLAPEWHRGWAVEFGRYFVHFPALGDTSFYDRMAAHASAPVIYTYRHMGWPSDPTFGRSEIYGRVCGTYQTKSFDTPDFSSTKVFTREWTHRRPTAG